METRTDLRRLYLELADGYEQREQPQFRDRFLVLAADAALAAGDEEEAERIRQRLLAANPHHLLKPYASFARAVATDDVRQYVAEQRQNYPADVAQGLLRSMHRVDEAHQHNIPVTAPILNLGGDPDVLMDDPEQPLKLFASLEEEKPAPAPAVPPTLPPESFPRTRSAPPPTRQVPQRPYEADLPPTLPPPPRPKPPKSSRTAPPPAPRPAPRAAPAPRPVKAPAPLPFAPTPAPVSRPADSEAGGAWFSAFLCGLTLATGVALAAYSLLRPLFFGP
jgi:hypothetical protein